MNHRFSRLDHPFPHSRQAVSLLGLLAAGWVCPVWAEDNSNYVYGTGSTTNFGGALNIPMSSPGTNNSLQILGGGSVTNTTGTIGPGASDNNNYALVSGLGSLWMNSSDLDVGSSGAGNQLIVTNGGSVSSLNGYVGYYGDNNSVWIGTNSVWNISGAGNGYFELGVWGKQNQLTITNGGQLINGPGYAVIGNLLTSSNNVVQVTGAGSVWSNGATLYLGYGGAYNQLIITDGGQVYNGAAQVGVYTTNVSIYDNSYANSVLVSGSNSLWNSSGDLALGYYGGQNQLIITNGGRVNNAAAIFGYQAVTASNNVVVVTGPGSVWSNSNYMIVGDTGAGNQLTITDGGRVDAYYGAVGYSDNNSVLVTGSNSVWSMPTSSLVVGAGGANNTMTIADGAKVITTDADLGDGSGGSNNVVVVTGTGSQWTNGADFAVGYNVGRNQLIITNGGRVDDGYAMIGGFIGVGTPAPSNNLVVVTGTNSLWNNTSAYYALTVGQQGAGNTLIVSNGGTVVASETFIGGGVAYGAASSSNNLVVVTGTGSLLTNWDHTYAYGVSLGLAGASNQLIISDGGRVESWVGYVGYYADYNTALVTGSTSVWNMTSSFEAGVSGKSNQLTVANGARVNSAGGYIGNATGSDGNSVTVTGSGSVWSNNGGLYVGFQGSGNQLILDDGAQMQNTGGTTIGYYHGSNQVTISGGSHLDNQGNVTFGYYGAPQGYTNNHNSALVTGSNSVWTTTGNIDLGYSGTDNQLVVSNGGQVLVGGPAYVGDGGGYNSVVVTDTGSVWSNGSTLYVGSSAPSNSLRVAEGAHLFSAGAYIGYNAAAGTNSVILTGSNTVWENNGGDFYVGDNAGNNTLVISNGARINNRSGFVAHNSASSGNNSIIVDGTGSTWSNSSSFIFGDTGGSNQMTVSAGGRIDSGGAAIGYTDNNTILITGSNSLWSLPNDSISVGLAGGSGGNNNLLTIANGAQLVSSYGYINQKPTATNDVVVVSGPGAQWTNSNALYVGYAGANDALIVTNGGRVDSAYAYISYLGPGYIATYPTASNTVIVTGTNSLWNSPGNLILGYYGGGYNQLLISDGGRVNDGIVYEGYGVAAGTNTFVVSGSGSVWSNTGDLNLGYTAGGDSLTVSGGARVDAKNLNAYATDNNTILVTGSNTLVSLPTGGLALGANNASLTILNGAKVVASDGYIADGTNGTNNIAVVSGPGSQWTNLNSMTVGYTGPGGQLIVTNGGRVDAVTGYIGYYGPLPYGYRGTGATVTVTGSNSLWNNSGTLFIGTYGAGQNKLIISDGGRVSDTDAKVGYFYDGAGSNTIVVSGAGSVWNNSGSIDFSPYGASYDTGNNQLIVTNGGQVNAVNGNFYGGANNSILVSGSNSLVNMSSYLQLGGNNTRITIIDGARVVSGTGYIGADANATNNIAIVSGAGSQWTNSSHIWVGYESPHNLMVITNGGRVDDYDGLISPYGPGLNPVYHGYSNTVIVTDPGSLWNNTADLIFGIYGGSGGDRLVITNGGRVNNNNTYFGDSYTGGGGNQIVVTGAGSVWSNAGAIYFSYNSLGGNHVTVSDGGLVYSVGASVGGTANNGALVTGNGSQWLIGAGGLSVSSADPGNAVQVSNGGLLEANSMVVSAGATPGAISNVGGIYQFTTRTPTVTPNGAGNISIQNGTISFRDISDADVFSDVVGSGNQVANIVFSGDNAFRLNNASNRTDIAQSYTFDAGVGPTNYVRLELINGHTAWRSANLTIGTGGSMWVSNTTAMIAAPLLVAGDLEVANSTATFGSNVVISGKFRSDPSTNIFLGDVTVVPSGVLAGSAGDLFDFQQSLLIHATNASAFDLISSTVLFSGGVEHTNLITGIDLGTNGFYGGNFEYGTLRLGSNADEVCVLSGDTNPDHGLYVNWLDLGGDTNLIANLHAPVGIDLYYLVFDPRNAYLNGLTYQLTDCNGAPGGFLMAAIPEPSALLLALLAGAALVRFVSRGVRLSSQAKPLPK